MFETIDPMPWCDDCRSYHHLQNPSCFRLTAERSDQLAAILEHNQRMRLLRSNGAAYRDRLVRERLNLRRAE